MDPNRKERLEKAGYKFYDSPAEILGLSQEDMAEVDRMVAEARGKKENPPPNSQPETVPPVEA